MERYICIHGHFYQPPRENPWLETVEEQDSAAPYHDWNERITAECYGPNAASRMVDESDRITAIVNNYDRISFNFGPTLLSWLQAGAPKVYAAVLEADRRSRERFSGHGSAIAQVYNHMILPLASRRDKRTQVLWGLRDFEHRFGRPAEGMWLPETAADTETLETLAEAGVAFTVLAPSQARRVRRIGSRAWRDVGGGRVDPSRAYQVQLPSGRALAVLFYDGPISRAVAFEGLLQRGEYLAGRLRGAFVESRDWPQLVHIATDGETYGHHHRFGNRALAYALHHIEEEGTARLTNYGEYLERHPPDHQAEIFEPSAWSCVHGVGRWWTDCGCNSGGRPGWRQTWRTALRQAFDWLRDTLAPRFERDAATLLRDPWAARDGYVDVLLDRGPDSRARFLKSHAVRELDGGEAVRVWKLLELQRHAQLAYTSCGWFFDDVSGIETVQVMRYAGAAVQLARDLWGEDLEGELVSRLSAARSNLHEQGDGGRVYSGYVKPSMVDLPKVAAHYAISSLLEEAPARSRVYCYSVEPEVERTLRTGRTRLVVGRARFTSEITCETARLTYGAAHFGDHNVNAGVRESPLGEDFEALARETTEAFEGADMAGVIRIMDRHFGETSHSLRTLFRDDQRRVLGRILESTLEAAATLYAQIYENHAPLMRFLAELNVPQPRAFLATAEFVINSRLRQALRSEETDLQAVRALHESAAREGVPLDGDSLGYALGRRLEELMERLRADPGDLELLQRADALAALAGALPFEVKLWQVQNAYFELLGAEYPARARGPEPGARLWAQRFRSLGEALGFELAALES